jgi:hypothetical protein
MTTSTPGTEGYAGCGVGSPVGALGVSVDDFGDEEGLSVGAAGVEELVVGSVAVVDGAGADDVASDPVEEVVVRGPLATLPTPFGHSHQPRVSAHTTARPSAHHRNRRLVDTGSPLNMDELPES